jgi:hypothetical protein
MRGAGFQVEARDVDDDRLTQTRQASGVPERLAACHTAQVGGYVVEGHVPAETVKRLLREHPAVAGIAVGGMPIGSPGMEMGARHEPYQVYTFTRDGVTAVYERH